MYDICKNITRDFYFIRSSNDNKEYYDAERIKAITGKTISDNNVNIKDFVEEIFASIKKFKDKFKFLQETWPHTKDNDLARIITPILYTQVKPIYFAILADNNTYFEEHYKHNNGDENRLLVLACICGSRKIATILFEPLHRNYTNLDCGYILSCVATSPNFDWAIEMATDLKKANYCMPLEIYSFVENPIRIKKLVEIFSRGISLPVIPIENSNVLIARGYLPKVELFFSTSYSPDSVHLAISRNYKELQQVKQEDPAQIKDLLLLKNSIR